MANIGESLDEAISSVERLRKSLSKSKTKQVATHDEQVIIKATAWAWFNTCRPLLKALSGDGLLKAIDSQYQATLEAAERATLRKRYLIELKLLKSSLVKLRSQVLALNASGELVVSESPNPPDFSCLIPDPGMQAILNRRWKEAWSCLGAGAHLASTVMMGAMLEALLLARVNKVIDKSTVFTSKRAPKDKVTGKTRPLQEWTLNSYIDVAHDLGWIGKASRDIGIVLRDYRNFIHPEKELSQGVSVGEQDCRIFGAILVVLAEQIVKS
ncbi:MAG: hypothetical protein CV089_14880 [Nitrospira sp. WS110]|nr:hypothetical protein [Nitrospira sp. WS110]